MISKFRVLEKDNYYYPQWRWCFIWWNATIEDLNIMTLRFEKKTIRYNKRNKALEWIKRYVKREKVKKWRVK